jgi:O-antigen/teichoic acid export membrane protein
VTGLAPARVALAPDLRRFARAIVPTAAAAALQLATFVLTGRALGPETFGLLAATYAIAAVATDVAGLGGDAAMVRAVAVDPSRRPAALGHALILLAASYPPVALAATAAAALLVGGSLGPGTVALLVCGDILVGRATAAAELVQVALGRPTGAGLVRLAAVAARAATAVLVFVLLRATDAHAWAIAAATQSAVTAGLILALCGRPRPRIDRDALGFGLLLMLNGLARSLAANLDRIVLAALLPPAVLGLYAAGSRLQLVGAVTNQAATRILYPRFFRAAEAGPAALATLTRSAALAMAAVGLLASVGIAAVAPLLPLLLGPDFAGTAAVAAALGLACPFVALQYPPADALTACGRQPLRTAVTFAGVLAAALLLAAGASAAGLAGAVAGFVAGQAALAALLWLAFARCRR